MGYTTDGNRFEFGETDLIPSVPHEHPAAPVLEGAPPRWKVFLTGRLIESFIAVFCGLFATIAVVWPQAFAVGLLGLAILVLTGVLLFAITMVSDHRFADEKERHRRDIENYHQALENAHGAIDEHFARYERFLTQIPSIPRAVRDSLAKVDLDGFHTSSPRQKAELTTYLMQEVLNAGQESFEEMVPKTSAGTTDTTVTLGLMLPFRQNETDTRPTHLHVIIRSEKNFCADALDVVPIHGSMAGRVIDERLKALFVKDAAKLPFSKPETFGAAKSLIWVPVKTQMAAHFVLAVGCTIPGALNFHHIRLMRAMADLCAIIMLFTDFNRTFQTLFSAEHSSKKSVS